MKKGLGYMHWLPGLLLAFVLQIVLYSVLNYVLPDFIYHNFSFNVRIHLILIISLLFPLIVDALWYLLTLRRYAKSTGYAVYCILRIISRIGEVSGAIMDVYEVTKNRGIVSFYFVITIVAFILLFAIFCKKYEHTNESTKEIEQ